MYEWIGRITANDKLLLRLARVCSYMPRRLLFILCKLIGTILYRFIDDQTKKNIQSNMLEMLGYIEKNQLLNLTRRYFENIAVTLYEILVDANQLKRTAKDRFQVEGEHWLTSVLEEGKGAIVYAPHMGNFFYYYWYLSSKYPCLTVATAGSAELRPLYMRFQELGCKGLDYDQTPPLELIRALKKHLESGGLLFILGDFYRPTFPLAHFFGRLSRTPEGAAMLAIEHQVPVIPMYGFRELGFKHHIIFHKPMLLHEWFQRNQRSEANDVLNQSMEEAIRLKPSQWFYWFNADERWENKPESKATRRVG